MHSALHAANVFSHRCTFFASLKLLLCTSSVALFYPVVPDFPLFSLFQFVVPDFSLFNFVVPDFSLFNFVVPDFSLFYSLKLFVTLCSEEKWKRFHFILNLELGLKRVLWTFHISRKLQELIPCCLYSTKSVNYLLVAVPWIQCHLSVLLICNLNWGFLEPIV